MSFLAKPPTSPLKLLKQMPKNALLGLLQARTEAAKRKAVAAKALCNEGNLSFTEIAGNLGISKGTLYSFCAMKEPLSVFS